MNRLPGVSCSFVSIVFLLCVNETLLPSENISMNANPNLLEFHGKYNVPFGSEQDEKIFIEPGVIESDLVPISYNEMNEVTDLLIAAAAKLGISREAIYFDLGMTNRTAYCSPRDPEFLTLEFVHSLQNTVLKSNPLWRVVVPATDEQNAFVVYKNSVKFSARNIISLASEIDRIRRIEVEIHTQIVDDEKRQFEAVCKKLLKAKLPEGKFRPWAIDCFESWKGDTAYMTIWLLQSGYAYRNQSWLSKEDGKVAKGFMGKTDNFDVTIDGRVIEYLTAGELFRGCLTCYVFRTSEFDGQIRICDPDTKDSQICRIEELLTPP